MASIPVNVALEDALQEKELTGMFTACAQCLGYATDFLMDALDPAKKSAAQISFGIFEDFISDAQAIYGLTREECMDVLNTLKDILFSQEIDVQTINKLEDAAGFSRLEMQA